MSEWFEKAFGEHYLQLYAHRDNSEAAQAAELIVRHTGLGAGALVLDAPCGAGRHVQAFRALGMRAFGFDLSPHLLRETVRDEVTRGRAVRADLRAMPFKAGRIDLLVNLFSSLGYFDSDEANDAVLKGLVELVRPGGWVVVDFMNSDFVRKNLMRESHRVTADALQVQDFRTIEGDPPRIKKKTIVTFPDGREEELRESVRLYTPEELRGNLEACGVEIEKEFGGYKGEAPGADAARVILMGRRR